MPGLSEVLEKSCTIWGHLYGPVESASHDPALGPSSHNSEPSPEAQYIKKTSFAIPSTYYLSFYEPHCQICLTIILEYLQLCALPYLAWIIAFLIFESQEIENIVVQSWQLNGILLISIMFGPNFGYHW